MGVATVTGGGGGAGACVDCLQPVDKAQTATAIQPAGFNNFLEDLVNFSERQPDSVLSGKNEHEARRAAFPVTAIKIIVLQNQTAEILSVRRPPALAVGGRCMMRLMRILMFPFFSLSIVDQLPLDRAAFHNE